VDEQEPGGVKLHSLLNNVSTPSRSHGYGIRWGQPLFSVAALCPLELSVLRAHSSRESGNDKSDSSSSFSTSPSKRPGRFHETQEYICMHRESWTLLPKDIALLHFVCVFELSPWIRLHSTRVLCEPSNFFVRFWRNGWFFRKWISVATLSFQGFFLQNDSTTAAGLNPTLNITCALLESTRKAGTRKANASLLLRCGLACTSQPS